MHASGSRGWRQSLWRSCFGRVRFSCAQSARVGVSMSNACASRIRGLNVKKHRNRLKLVKYQGLPVSDCPYPDVIQTIAFSPSNIGRARPRRATPSIAGAWENTNLGG